MDTPLTGVVVVTHNTRDDLLACLDSLADAGADRVVVVDCGSTDGTREAAATAHPGVDLLALPNLGFGRGANAGVAHLRQGARAGARVDAVVIANADTRFRAGSVAALGGYLRDHPDVGAVGPKVVHPDGRLQLSARSFPDIPTAIGHAVFGLVWPANPWTRRYRLTDWDHQSERDVDWLSGCCIAVGTRAFEEVGGFDPAYFMFVEDVDMCWRMGEQGWRVVFAPVTEVVHAIGASVGRQRTRMVLEHARSLDRFFARRYRGGPLTRVLIRAGLLAWSVSIIAWSRARGRTHAQG